MAKAPDIQVFTAPTMNGWKPLIFLEEAGVGYELAPVSFAHREQKSAWYMALNPVGQIPTIVDRGNGNLVVFQSGAIPWYLAEKFDRFLPKDARGRTQAFEWLMFQMSSIGPMMGQAMYFQRIAEPQGHRDAYAIERYVRESRRLLEVVDRQLAGKAYIPGDDYSIVDMPMYPWARSHFWAKVPTDGWSNLQSWLQNLDRRPAIMRAMQFPEPFPAFFSEGDVAAAEHLNSKRFSD